MLSGPVFYVLALSYLAVLKGNSVAVESSSNFLWRVFVSMENPATTTTTSSPPPHDKYALMARYIMHVSDWVSIGTISTQESIRNYPFVGLKSLSDGTTSNSTGVPYLYMTNQDVSGADVLANNRVTIMATLAQSDYCDNHDIDPQDPRCAKVMISGPLIRLTSGTVEYKFGQKALFERHPAMRHWPSDHGFYVAKVEPQQILVLDFFGGIKPVDVKDYFNPTLKDLVNVISDYNTASVIQVGARN